MAFCSKCGKELAIATSLCEGCRTATNSTLVITQNPSVSDAENLKLFIGKNYEYFFKKWTIAEKRKSKLSWNWAAFLLGFSWMAYRKMYRYSWLFIGLVVVEAICEYIFNVPESVSCALNVSIAATFGSQGNAWYKLHVEKKVNEITTMNPPEKAKVELEEQGGASIGAAIGFAVALFVRLFLVGVVAGE